jgi:putative endonuclease
MSEKEKETEKWGKVAEQLAAEYLMSKGYIIRERNWRPNNSHLEVDIISQSGEELIFVEVKARNPHGEYPEDAVDKKKINRLVRAATIYLEMQNFDYTYRFDIIAITGTSASDAVIEHYEDAFLPPLTTR